MIRYESGAAGLLPRVAPLWERLKAHHVSCSVHFALDMAAASFASRCRQLRAKAGIRRLRVDLARDGRTGCDIGYCVSSVTRSRQGEIDSLFVDPGYRGRRVGDALMRKALAWLRKKNATSIIIGVVAGNERVLTFYSRFGFYPRGIILARPKRVAARRVRKAGHAPGGRNAHDLRGGDR